MNYQKIHDSIINRAKDRKLKGYKERHHITPRCIGGSDDPDNLIELTAREHFIIHWLLTLIYPDENGLKFAFWNMCQRGHSSKLRYKPSSRIYEWARKQLKGIPKPKGFQVGENNTFYGKSHTKETRDKISKLIKNREFSEEHRRKLSEAAKRRKGNKSNPHKGKRYEDFMSADKAKKIKKNLSKKLKGKKLSKEHKQKLKDAHIRLKNAGISTKPKTKEHIESLKKSFIKRDLIRKEKTDNKWISLLEAEIEKGLTIDNYSNTKKYFKKIKYRGLDISKYEWLIPEFKKMEHKKRCEAQARRNKKMARRYLENNLV